jgi:hypothetical protein
MQSTDNLIKLSSQIDLIYLKPSLFIESILTEVNLTKLSNQIKSTSSWLRFLIEEI